MSDDVRTLTIRLNKRIPVEKAIIDMYDAAIRKQPYLRSVVITGHLAQVSSEPVNYHEYMPMTAEHPRKPETSSSHAAPDVHYGSEASENAHQDENTAETKLTRLNLSNLVGGQVELP